jgi:hypothetical protein
MVQRYKPNSSFTTTNEADRCYFGMIMCNLQHVLPGKNSLVVKKDIPGLYLANAGRRKKNIPDF